MNYESHIDKESRACPGVRFRVRRLSLARRMELVEAIRQTGQTLEFHEAGGTVSDAASAAAIRARIDALYIRWGLAAIDGLQIDGLPATVDSLLESGPDPLAREIAAAVQEELLLSPEERKN